MDSLHVYARIGKHFQSFQVNTFCAIPIIPNGRINSRKQKIFIFYQQYNDRPNDMTIRNRTWWFYSLKFDEASILLLQLAAWRCSYIYRRLKYSYSLTDTRIHMYIHTQPCRSRLYVHVVCVCGQSWPGCVCRTAVAGDGVLWAA